MSLGEEKITLSISLDSLAYILTNEFDRETFLEFIGRMADINADTGFEWSVIEMLFDLLLDSDPVAARLLLRMLAPVEEEDSSEACYTYDGVGGIFFWPFGPGPGADHPFRAVASYVDQGVVQFIVDSLNERGKEA